jgi:hypothetical protein
MFKEKIIYKRDLWKRTLDEQERHLTLGILSSEGLMPEGRKRAPAQNNKEAKSE